MAKGKGDKSGGSGRSGSGSKEKDQPSGRSSGAGAGRGSSTSASPGRSSSPGPSPSGGAGAGRGSDPRSFGGGSGGGSFGQQNKSDLRDDFARDPRPQMRPDKPDPRQFTARPQPRPDPAGPMPLYGYAGMSPAERLREQQMADQFAALENRADLAPRFENDPLAEWGHDAVGGLMGVDFLPRDPYGAWHFGGGYRYSDYEQELADPSRPGAPIFESYMEMDPVAATEFAQRQREYLVEPGGIGIGPNYFTPAVQVHEYRHEGFDALQRAIDQNPALADRFNYMGVPLPLPGVIDRDFEEAIVEVMDNPLDTWIQPRGENPVGTYATVAPSIQFLPDPADARRPLMEAYNAAAQNLTRELMTEQRGFGPAVMQTAPPGNIYYQEPAINRGIGGLFSGLSNRVSGIFN